MKKLIAISMAAVIALISAAFLAVPASAAVTHGLPAEYKELEYIESDGDQVIDTGIPLSSKLAIECTFQITNDFLPGTGSVAGICGAYPNGGGKYMRFQIGYGRSEDLITLGLGKKAIYKEGNTETKVLPKDLNKHTGIIDAVNGQIIFDGEVLLSEPDITQFGFEEKNLCNITIGAAHYGSSTDSLGSLSRSASKIFHVKLSVDNVVVAEFIPALRIADNYVGMYDIVRNQFFENAVGDMCFLADPAVVTTEAEVTTAAPETDAPTEAEVTTGAPETGAPTEAEDTTAAPETTATAEEKGCSSSVAMISVAIVALTGCALIRRKH